MTDRLISLQAAIFAAGRSDYRGLTVEEVTCVTDVVIEELKTLPEAIIRCRDCKYTDGCEPIEDGRYWCCIHESFMYYCSDAERKEQDG